MRPKTLNLATLNVGGLDNNDDDVKSTISGISMSKFGGRGSALPSPGGGDFTKDSRVMW
jgi:hypothetical protein